VSALNKCGWNYLKRLDLGCYLINGQVRTKCKNSILQDWERVGKLRMNMKRQF
jgi:hypothetical protein